MKVKKIKAKLKQTLHEPVSIPRGSNELVALGYMVSASEGQVRKLDKEKRTRVLEALHHCYIFTDNGQFDEVKTHAEKGLNFDPENPALKFYLLMAQVNLQQKIPDLKLSQFTPEDDRSGATAYMLGQYYEKTGLLEKAISLYELAVKQNPLFIDPSLSLMILSFSTGNIEHGKKYLDIIKKYGTEEIEGAIAEAIWSFFQGNAEGALEKLDTIKYTKTSETSLKYWIIKGYISASINQKKAALDAFLKAYNLGYASPEFLLSCAALAVDCNDLSLAQKLFQHFVQQYPNHKESDNVREILKAYSGP